MGDSDVYTSLGTMALSEQEDSIALLYSSDALKLKNNNGRAWLGKAMVKMLKQEFQQAETSFNSAIKYMPKHLDTWQALTWCKIAQNNIKEAEITIKQALLIDDNFAESHGVLAIIKLTQGKIDLVMISIKRAIGLDKYSFSGLYAQALMLKHQGQSENTNRIIEGILDSLSQPNQRSLREVLLKHLATQKTH